MSSVWFRPTFLNFDSHLGCYWGTQDTHIFLLWWVKRHLIFPQIVAQNFLPFFTRSNVYNMISPWGGKLKNVPCFYVCWPNIRKLLDEKYTKKSISIMYSYFKKRGATQFKVHFGVENAKVISCSRWEDLSSVTTMMSSPDNATKISF